VTSTNVKFGVPQLSVAVGVVQTGSVAQSVEEGGGKGEMTGGVVSSKLIVCTTVAVFPQPSVAVHVLEIEYSFAQDPGVFTSAKVTIGVPQLSVAVGVTQVGVTEHSMVTGAGNAESTGGVVSSTLIVCAAVAVFPHASLGVHVLAVENSFGQLPGVITSADVNVGVEQLSDAVGVTHTGVTEHSMLEGAGKAEMTGGTVSSTLIVWDAVAVLPQISVAVQVRVIENSFGHVPGVLTSANVRTGVPQLSVAVGVVHVGVPVHSIVVGAGNAEITGGSMSCAVMV